MAEMFGPALSPAETDMLLKGALSKNTERATTVWWRPVTSLGRAPASPTVRSRTRNLSLAIYINIYIVGWSPSFEPAPGAAPAGLVACRNSEALPRKGPLSLYTYLQEST